MPGTSALDSARRALDTARDQYRGFSRTTRTLVIVGAVSVLLLGILEGWTAAEAYDKETARLLDNMDRARNARSQLRPAFRDRVMSLGSIRLPHVDLETTEAERLLKLAVDRVLAEHGAENEEISVSPGASLGASKLPEIPRTPGSRLTKIGLRVEFDCPQDNVMQIIRDLESDPEVYTVSRLQIRRYEDGQESVRKLLSVSLSMETWALSTPKGGGRG